MWSRKHQDRREAHIVCTVLFFCQHPSSPHHLLVLHFIGPDCLRISQEIIYRQPNDTHWRELNPIRTAPPIYFTLLTIRATGYISDKSHPSRSSPNLVGRPTVLTPKEPLRKSRPLLSALFLISLFALT